MRAESLPSGSARRLQVIEVGRGIAALAVVIFHANVAAPQFGGPTVHLLALGRHGVDFFFVLSGFIIVTAHRDDRGRPGAVGSYLLKRAIRLLPMLWLVVLGWAALRLVAGVGADPAQVARSLLPWPSLARPDPVVIWTLRHEIVFYLVFAVLIANARIGTVLFALWGAGVLAQAAAVAAGAPLTGVPSLVLSTYALDFLMGAGVAQLHRRGRLPHDARLLIVGSLALVVAFAIDAKFGLYHDGVRDYVSPTAAFWPPVLGLVFATLIAGMLGVEHRHRAPRWAVMLGSASYATYLVHLPVTSVLQRVVDHLPGPLLAVGAGQAAIVAGGVGAGIVAHLAFERPATRALRRRLLPLPATQAAAQGERP